MNTDPTTSPKVPARMVPRCFHCGYNVTGRRVEENCPECGQPVWDAVRLAPTMASPASRRAHGWAFIACITSVAQAGLTFLASPYSAFWPFAFALSVAFALGSLAESRVAGTRLKRGMLPTSEARYIVRARILACIALTVAGMSLFATYLSTI